jgi:hypothetical protein
MNIEEILKAVLGNFNIEKYSFKQKNKIGKLHIVLNEEWCLHIKKNMALVEAIKSLPIINYYHYDAFSGGKKTENKTKYTFEFSLKKEYYDGTYELNEHHGYMLKLIQEKGIKTKEDLYRATIDMIKNMSDFTHTLKFKEKLKYRETKLNYIEGLYKSGFIESLAHQISYCNDNLVLFKTKFGHEFHLRRDDCHFVPTELPLLPMLYMKRQVDVDNIDMEFQQYLSVLKRPEHEFMLKNAEII